MGSSRGAGGGLQNTEDLPSLAGYSVPRVEQSFFYFIFGWKSTTLPDLKSSLSQERCGYKVIQTHYKVQSMSKTIKLECNKLSEKGWTVVAAKNNIWERWLENLVIGRKKKK